jgi:hypothetical protein
MHADDRPAPQWSRSPRLQGEVSPEGDEHGTRCPFDGTADASAAQEVAGACDDERVMRRS